MPARKVKVKTKTTGAQSNADSFARIAESLSRIADAAECAVGMPPAKIQQTLKGGGAFRWRAAQYGGVLEVMQNPRGFFLADLRGLNDEIKAVRENTARFMRGKTAHNVLLTGARGSGKSSLMRGVLGEFAKRGLRVIETDGEGLAKLPYLTAPLSQTREKYAVFCDDLSFAEDPPPAAVRSALEGSFAANGEGAIICATANRRHLSRDKYSDAGDEIHPGESAEEKLALADRFGLWLRIYAPDVEEFEAMVVHWLRRYKVKPSPELLADARHYADLRGGRNGRLARQFAETAAGGK